MGYYEKSSTWASGAFFLTDSTPFSIAAEVEYISLVPITWPFVDVKLKYGLPSFAVFLSNLASSCEFFRTESIPFVHPPLDS